MTRDEIMNAYFEWLVSIVCGNRRACSRLRSYGKLLMLLHDTVFRYSVHNDENRATDGIALRDRFSDEYGCDDVFRLNDPCSVLEMMVALAVRCEEHIMADPDIGDRTRQWFWGMIDNLGLSGMTDSKFDLAYVEEKLQIFLERRYEPDGQGGLFTIRNCKYDLRYVEIWYQLCWYLDTVLGM